MSLRSITCGELHKEERNLCPATLPREGGLWKFCPRCGRSTAHLTVEEDGETVTVTHDKDEIREIPLRNDGLAPLTVRLRVRSEEGAITLASGQPPVAQVPRGAETRVKVQVAARKRKRDMAGYLEIASDDGKPGAADDPWNPDRSMQTSLPINITVEQPPDPYLDPPNVILHERVSSRTVTVRNRGGGKLILGPPSAPPGYGNRPIMGAMTSKNEFPLAIEVWREKAKMDGADTLSPAESQFHIVFFGAQKQELLLPVRWIPPTSQGRKPEAIIGVDFGTAFTSIAVREFEANVWDNNRNDPVSFVEVDGLRRFPTRIYFSNDGSIAYGPTATPTIKEQGYQSGGYLLREIKTLLREPENNDVFCNRTPDEARQFLRGKYGTDWQRGVVTEYLRWVFQITQRKLRERFGDDTVEVRYVISLPVLDHNFRNSTTAESDIYKMQRESMEFCLTAAGFPMEWCAFQMEPVCAALGIINPPTEADGSFLKEGGTRIPLSQGQRILVFDSGGGTTDVVVMQATIGDKGKISLSLEGCLGVQGKSQTFGGEMVTKKVLEAVERPSSIASNPKYPFHIGDPNLLAVFPDAIGIDDVDLTENSDEKLLFLDEAEILKIELSHLNEGQTVRRGSGDDAVEFTEYFLPYIVNGPLTTLVKDLNENLFQPNLPFLEGSLQPRQIDYYIPVGGNSGIPIISQWLSKYMGDKPKKYELSEDGRKIAVAYGATFAYDSRQRNTALYDVAVYATVNPGTPDAKDEQIFAVQSFAATDAVTKRARYDIPAGGSLLLRVQATLNAETLIVAQETLHVEQGRGITYRLRTAVTDGVVTVARLSETDPSQDAETLLRYQL